MVHLSANRLLCAVSTGVLLTGCSALPAAQSASAPTAVRFADVTREAGLENPRTWKYGGPAIADFDADGHLDFALTNHADVMPFLYWGRADGTYERAEFPRIYSDVHGIAPGDYDGDGDLDLLVAVGGGNGTTPRPPILLRNDNRQFRDVTEEAGLIGVGARGRAVRWIDLDSDGDLDILAINAIQLPGEDGPRQIAFENLGDGRFSYRSTGEAFEKLEAERVLLTDIDNDGRLDFVLFTPLSVWRNEGDFRFTDISHEALPETLRDADFVSAAAEFDIDNDGDFDLYFARGKTYYQLANNSVDFSPETGRLDLRDEGNRSRDGISFKADGPVTLRDFWHWQRGNNITLPVFLGAERVKADTPVEPLIVERQQAQGDPGSMEEDGWYLSYRGDGEWRLAWNLSDDLAWGIRASITGVSAVMPDWQPQETGVADILLINEGARFADGSALLPPGSAGNNWGVTAGDFDNDGRQDLFVHTFGRLRERRADLLLRNTDSGLVEITDHDATSDLGGNSHGDMGAAFDENRDGWIDMLNGDDDQGSWHLYRNLTGEKSGAGWSLVEVGYSPTGFDPVGAIVILETPTGSMVRRVGSAGEVHSQSIINPVHFGLGEETRIRSLRVRWRDGSEVVIENPQQRVPVFIGTRTPDKD